MYRLIPIILLCLLVGCKANEEKLIRKTLSDYKAAVLKDNGNEAVKYVDSQTIAYFHSLQQNAMTLDSIDIERLRLMDRYQLVMLKHMLKPNELRTMDGKQVLAFLINSKTINKETIMKMTPGNIVIRENNASAQILIDNKKAADFQFTFYKEHGNWKLSIMQLTQMLEPYLLEMIDKSGYDEHTLYDLAGAGFNDKFLDNSVWHPYK